MYKIGADPELFAFDKVKGSYISVHNLLAGTKKNPVPVEQGAVQVDGTAAEFNIMPAETMGQFVARIELVRNRIQSIIQQKNPNVVLVGQPWVEYSQDYWEKIPKKYKELGCDPDYNAYTGEINPRPDPEKLGRPSLRTGSGHIHIGWCNPRAQRNEDTHFLDCRLVVKAMDKILLPVYEHYFDQDKVRRELYGKPGAFRPKPYGVEYRVLSNKWVTDPEATRVVYAYTNMIMWTLNYFGRPMKLGEQEDQIPEAFNALFRHCSIYGSLPDVYNVVKKYPLSSVKKV